MKALRRVENEKESIIKRAKPASPPPPPPQPHSPAWSPAWCLSAVTLRSPSLPADSPGSPCRRPWLLLLGLSSAAEHDDKGFCYGRSPGLPQTSEQHLENRVNVMELLRPDGSVLPAGPWVHPGRSMPYPGFGAKRALNRRWPESTRKKVKPFVSGGFFPPLGRDPSQIPVI